MGLPHKVVKVTLSGDMFGGQEIWSTGFHMGFVDSDAPAITQQALIDVADAWSAFFTDLESMVSNRYSFKMVKMAMLDTNGKTVPDSAQYYSPTGSVVGGGGVAALPPQIALVATLANTQPRGLATKGRMFLPGINAQISDDGHLANVWCDNIAGNLKSFFDLLVGDADLPGVPVLASTGGTGLDLRPGAIRPINSVRVGNVYDTQRRRRNALTESYVSKPISGF